MARAFAAVAVCFLALAPRGARADDDSHVYAAGEPVVVWVSSLTPFHNPSESYSLRDDLPLCSPPRLPDSPAQRPPHLGELLIGSALQNSDWDVRFLKPVERARLCSVSTPISDEAARLLAFAVSNHYLAAFLVDDLPVYAMVGELVLDEESVEELERDAERAPHGIADNTFVYTVSRLDPYLPRARALRAQRAARPSLSPSLALTCSPARPPARARARPPACAPSRAPAQHRELSIGYSASGDQIVAVNLTVTDPVAVKAGATFDLTYSVQWVRSDVPFEQRFSRYIDNDLRRTQVRWFGVVNSALMAVFLCGTVALILLRTLRADFARYIRDEEEEGGGGGGAGGNALVTAGGASTGSVIDKAMGDETGWKLVSGDVFRRPGHIVLYSALVGVGSHLFLLSVLVIAASLAGSLHVDRGAVLKAAVFGYSVTSVASGFFSGAFYRGLMLGTGTGIRSPTGAGGAGGAGGAAAAAGGAGEEEGNRDWMRVMVLSAVLFPALCVGVSLVLSGVALAYGTSSYVSLWTILKLAAVWTALSLPLTIVGTMLGRRSAPAAGGVPFRVVPVPRPVPARPWFASRLALVLLAGFLPFGSVFVEIYYVATSAWGHAIYAAWAIFLVVLLILAMVVSCVSIVSVYLLLNAEDHAWHWHSFLSGASVALYVFAYACYFFVFRTEMTGALQAAFYFGYSGLACCGLALMTGTVGTVSAAAFVRAIYSSIKGD